MDLPKIIEYDNALYIDGYKIPFIVKDSIIVEKDGPFVTLTVAVSSYQRIFEKKETTECYSFNNENLPK